MRDDPCPPGGGSPSARRPARPPDPGLSRARARLHRGDERPGNRFFPRSPPPGRTPAGSGSGDRRPSSRPLLRCLPSSGRVRGPGRGMEQDLRGRYSRRQGPALLCTRGAGGGLLARRATASPLRRDSLPPPGAAPGPKRRGRRVGRPRPRAGRSRAPRRARRLASALSRPASLGAPGAGASHHGDGSPRADRTSGRHATAAPSRGRDLHLERAPGVAPAARRPDARRRDRPRDRVRRARAGRVWSAKGVVKPVLLLDVVGLTRGMLGAETPHLSALARDGFAAELAPVLPAVTCSAQATMVTGKLPRDHGIVGNGWYFRELNEVWLWRQSGALVQGEKLWDAARRRDPSLRCANLFWWYNMNTTADLGVTPRPTYPADGSKLFGIYTYPHGLRLELESALGEFPFHTFWGPGAAIDASQWIGRAAQHVIEKHRPTVTLVYLPHLDYDFQRYGASDPRARAEVTKIDRVAGELIAKARARGAAVLVVSEYGITDARHPLHPNRVLREAGLLSALETPLGWELLDFGELRAFAVADHQIAHVYVKRRQDRDRVADILRSMNGVERVLDDAGKAEFGLDHERAGDLVAVAERDAWFTYYYWLDDARAPDFARTVDIHRKPGYDPVELFLGAPKAKVAARLLKKKLGFRY